MRTLKFIVNNDRIERDPSSDFSMLSDETRIQAEFTFSEDWNGFAKVAGFERGNKELDPRILLHGTTCDIPYEVLYGTFFRMYVIGKSGTRKLKTKPILISMNEK